VTPSLPPHSPNVPSQFSTRSDSRARLWVRPKLQCFWVFGGALKRIRTSDLCLRRAEGEQIGSVEPPNRSRRLSGGRLPPFSTIPQMSRRRGKAFKLTRPLAPPAQYAARSAVQTQRVTWGTSSHSKEAPYDGNLDASWRHPGISLNQRLVGSNPTSPTTSQSTIGPSRSRKAPFHSGGARDRKQPTEFCSA
jgi:hypothetical protein